jgi:predicted GNAT family N-acyltransferase
MMWLDETPRAVVRAHLRMLPRLQAEESLHAAERVAVGSASLKREASGNLVREWLRLARGDQPPERLTAQAMGSAGIGYRRVVKRKESALTT